MGGDGTWGAMGGAMGGDGTWDGGKRNGGRWDMGRGEHGMPRVACLVWHALQSLLCHALCASYERLLDYVLYDELHVDPGTFPMLISEVRLGYADMVRALMSL